MTARKQPDVLSAGDQCGGRIAHIKFCLASGRKEEMGDDEGVASARARW